MGAIKSWYFVFEVDRDGGLEVDLEGGFVDEGLVWRESVCSKNGQFSSDFEARFRCSSLSI
jgi:hypothetical protein